MATRYPTRLLEIDKPELNQVRLTEGRLLEVGSQYVTLSHCWGQSQVSKLTQQTKQRIEDGVPISELGKTFRDAIQVAREIGVPYIWIDSLCIIQDQLEDWLYEAPRMTDIYSGSLLNIAATSGPDSESGLIPRRDLPPVTPFLFPLDENDPASEQYTLYDHKFTVNSFVNMPLITRAWVVQELLLAPRVLHFCGTQMFWECAELSACETYPNGFPPGLDAHGIRQHTLWNIFHPGGSSRSKFRLLNKWKEIVDVYSRCSLTYQSDRLVAISGIAKLFQRSLKADYYAGLWSDGLEYQLLWTGRTLERRYPPTSYIAPTWSWASMDGPVESRNARKQGDVRKTLITIKDCHIETRTSDDTVGILSGSLRLSGWLVTVVIVQLRRIPEKPERGFDIFMNGVWAKSDNCRVYLDRKVTTDLVHALPVISYTLPDHGTHRETYADFLLLCPTGDASGRFYRIGAMYAKLKDFGLQDDIPRHAFRGIKNEPWLNYESCDATGLYTVVIV